MDVVQSLGEYLTDDDTTVRAKGLPILSAQNQIVNTISDLRKAIGYLSAVLGCLDTKSLSRQQGSFFFFLLLPEYGFGR